MVDAAEQIVRSVLDGIAERDRKVHESIRSEIATKGTWWAADEIQKLREQVAAFKREQQARSKRD